MSSTMLREECHPQGLAKRGGRAFSDSDDADRNLPERQSRSGRYKRSSANPSIADVSTGRFVCLSENYQNPR
jgi:hypothetical protein